MTDESALYSAPPLDAVAEAAPFEHPDSPGRAARHPVEIQQRATTLAIIGLGYVGLPIALAAHANGARTIGVDISPSRLNAITKLDVDLIPTDLQLLASAIRATDFTVTADVARLSEADAVMICVPTPIDEHQNPQLDALRSACELAVAHARPGQVLILTSTSFPGSTRTMLAEPLIARGFIPGEDVYVASSPERIDPGNEVFPQGSVPRVVGGVTNECTRRAVEILSTVTPLVHPVSSPEAAEMSKLLENSFRAVNIAFAHEVADICRAMGLNVAEVIDAAATKPYGFMPFYPSSGVGGHCIPCDPHYLLWKLNAERSAAPMLAHAMQSIASRPHDVVDQLSHELSASGRSLRGARLLVVGVAYKPGVRDIRESPGIEIVVELLRRGARVEYHDPLIPSISIDAQQVMLSVVEPDPTLYDAVVLSTMHGGVDYSWLSAAAMVHDPSGRYSRPFSEARDRPVPSDRSYDIEVDELPRVAEPRAAFSVGG